MSVDELLVTLDAVLDALPDTIDKQHPERLKTIRDVIGLIITARKLHK